MFSKVRDSNGEGKGKLEAFAKLMINDLGIFRTSPFFMIFHLDSCFFVHHFAFLKVESVLMFSTCKPRCRFGTRCDVFFVGGLEVGFCGGKFAVK